MTNTTTTSITNRKKLGISVASMAMFIALIVSVPNFASASLIGDEVTVELVNATEGTRNAIVNSTEYEFEWAEPGFCGSPDESISMNFSSNTIEISLGDNTGNFLFCDDSSNRIDDPLVFNISSLDWVDQPSGIVVGITNTTNPSLPTSYAVTGPHSVQINITGSAGTPNFYGETFGFELQTLHAVNVTKSWTHTDYNWDQRCDGYFNSTSGLCEDSITNSTEIGFRPANINIDADVLADKLPNDGTDYLLNAQIHKNGKFSNTNPGAFYALTAVNVTEAIDGLTVIENYSDCTDTQSMLELHNDKKQSRSIKIAIADPSGDVTEITDDIYDGIGGQIVSIDDLSAEIEIDQAIDAGSMVYVLVKFQDQLKNEEWLGDLTCTNSESVDATVGLNISGMTADASLKITELN